jgi:hypothetical protein
LQFILQFFDPKKKKGCAFQQKFATFVKLKFLGDPKEKEKRKKTPSPGYL